MSEDDYHEAVVVFALVLWSLVVFLAIIDKVLE